MATRFRLVTTLLTMAFPAAVLLSACGPSPTVASTASAGSAGSTASAGSEATSTSSAAQLSPSPEPASVTVDPTTPASLPATTRPASTVSAADQLAGIRSTAVPWSAGGVLQTVPGSSPAPGKGRIYSVRVEVEKGLNIDRAKFATFVLATLNDKRSWTENGRRRFARTDGSAKITVILASPQKSAAICAPLRTFGKLSCRSGSSAVLTYYRWIKAIPEYSSNHDGYRHYMVNHEVGHVLGHAHQYCAGPGKVAPVMMQQTKGLRGCRPNPWPHP
jgi:hypothetical protein